MGFRLSGDQVGPGFGFLTRCTTFDKLFHVFGAAFCTVAAWIVVYFGGRSIPLFPGEALEIAVYIVAAGGVGLEIWQGIKNARYEAKMRALLDYDLASPDEIAAVENAVSRLDGFSLRDILANSVGQLVVGLLYYVLFRLAAG